MKKYDSYKDSGIEWIGEIPEHWNINRLRNIADSIKTGSTPPSEEIQYFEPKDINWYGPGDFDDLILYDAKRKISNLSIKENICRLFPPNSILLIGIGATVGKVGIVSEASTSNQQINAIILKNEYNPKYYTYFISTIKDIIVMEASSATLPIFNQTQTKNIVLPVPEIFEQTTIANYLDHKTTQIDTLIAKKEQFIILLQEERTAVINHAVTKGLDPKVKMKDSGIEWLGEIPEHWEVKKLKFVSKITRGAILRPVDEPSYFDDNGEWTYLNISDATICDKYLDYGKLRLSELGSTKSARVEPNNLIITASATIGKPFINKIPVCVHDGFIPITELKVNIDFLYNYFKNPQLFNGLGKSNTQKNIYLEDVKNLIIPIPNLEEQLLIARYIEEEIIRIETLISKSLQEIELLKEYKTALISEVVTGKVDVRDVILN